MVLLCLVVPLALASYLYMLGGVHIPSIGDESVYAQIVRLTAKSGDWLPLASIEGLAHTKPPLLFWQGMITTDWAQDWSLLRLRLPMVAWTFATAALVGWTTRQLVMRSRSAGPLVAPGTLGTPGPLGTPGTPGTETASVSPSETWSHLEGGRAGILAALSFLAFFSTFRYGRPFLTNMPEVFLSFAICAAVILNEGRRTYRSLLFWCGLGFVFGLVLLTRSVALLVPMGLWLTGVFFSAHGWSGRELLKRDLLKLLVFSFLALGVFSLWIVLSPDPVSVVREFIGNENVAKLRSDGYWRTFLSGNYSWTRIWLGHAVNTGFLFFPAFALLVIRLRSRTRVSRQEKLLAWFILAYLVVFTLPNQRSPSYVLSGTPAIAVLLGWHWRRIPDAAFRITALLLLLVWLGFSFFSLRVDGASPLIELPVWHWPLVAVGVALCLGLVIRAGWARVLIHAPVFLFFLLFGSVQSALEAPRAEFDLGAIAASPEIESGEIIFAPSTSRANYEQYTFRLPGYEVRGYWTQDKQAPWRILEKGHAVIVPIHTPEDRARIARGEYVQVASRIGLRTRHNSDEIKRIIFKGETDLLVREEVLLRKKVTNSEAQ